MSCMIEEAQPDNDHYRDLALSAHFKLWNIPNRIHVFRKDRVDGFGGVLIACRNGIYHL